MIQIFILENTCFCPYAANISGSLVFAKMFWTFFLLNISSIFIERFSKRFWDFAIFYNFMK